MIYIERKIKIKKNEAKIEEPIVLYKGDMNIELQFTIENNPFKYKPGMDVTYGQLVIKRPKGDPVFSEPVKMSSSKVIFIVTGDMIDGLDADGNYKDEMGAYDFQIQLLNGDQSSRGSLPPVAGGIIIREPLCEPAAVNRTYANNRNAVVMPANNAVTFALRDSDDIFDEDGNYNKSIWSSGDIITDDRLNRVEDALYQINDDIPTDYASIEYVDDMIKVNTEFIEDYVDGVYTKKTDMYIYATQDYVKESIDDIDLSIYTTHDYVSDMIDNNNDYIDDRYATQNYVDDAISNIEVGGADLNIMTIGDGINEYIFTGNEFSNEYDGHTGKTVLLDNVIINFIDDAKGGQESTITYYNQLVYIKFFGSGSVNKAFLMYSIAGDLGMSDVARYNINEDGVITRSFCEKYSLQGEIKNVTNQMYKDFATKDELQTALGDIESLLGGI